VPGGTVRVVVGRNRQLGSGPRSTTIATGPHRVVVVVGAGVGVVVVVGAVPDAGQLTALLTVALGEPVQFPAVAVTVTYTLSSRVVVVSVVEVPVTVLLCCCSPSVRLDATVYCDAPVTPVQLTGMVAVVVPPLVVHVIAPIVTPPGVPIWPARAVAVPVFVVRQAAVATPPPASSSTATTAATAATRGPGAGRLTRS
jgi:hypothetical protein